MKNFYFYFCFFIVVFCSKAFCQTNLVPNGSFEILDTCPNLLGQFENYVANWYSPTLGDGNSACYYNFCAPYSSYASVPRNGGGYQYAASGNGYVGVQSYTSVNVTPDGFSQIIGVQLTSPLVIGQKYYVKFNVNCAMGQNFNTGIDKMGARFCNMPHNNTTSQYFNNFAHIYTNNIVSDTTNWVTISGSFIADSAYSYIEIGNFFKYPNNNKQVIRITGSSDQAYYYIDDVCASTDSLYTTGWQWTTGRNNFSNEENISLFPNPSLDGFIYTNKSFTNENGVIYDVLGHNVKSFSINGNKIDLTDLQNGIYFIQVNSNHNYFKQKIIIQKQ